MSIVIVSGARRTGTSMMMSALYKGSSTLDLLVAPVLEKANPAFKNYQPNPNGLYEVGLVRYLEARFLRKIPNDCLIKVLYDGLPNLYPNDYKIIWMDRDEDEIRASEERVDRHFKDCDKEAGTVKKDHNEYTQILPFCSLRPYSKEDVDHVLKICEMRKDFDLVRVNYRDVIEDPIKAFKKIKWTPLGRLRVDIDVEKAASVIDKKLHRFKSEAIDEHSSSRYEGSAPESYDHSTNSAPC